MTNEARRLELHSPLRKAATVSEQAAVRAAAFANFVIYHSALNVGSGGSRDDGGVARLVLHPAASEMVGGRRANCEYCSSHEYKRLLLPLPPSLHAHLVPSPKVR